MELITVAEARARIGIAKAKMTRLVASGIFTIYQDPRDARHKLLDAAEVEEYLRPKVLRPRAEDRP